MRSAGDWQIDGTLDGTQLETEGWTYAVDFPAAYSAQKRFTSCVRRRRWVRYRRYVAVNAWSAVPPLHRVRGGATRWCLAIVFGNYQWRACKN